MTDNITLPRAIVQQVLDALERTNSEPGSMAYEREAKASVALEDALCAAPQQQAEPVQEPFEDLATELFVVAQRSPADEGFSDTIDRIESWLREHFSTQPQRKPLTDEEIDQLLPEIVSGGSFTVVTYGRAVARAIEAKLKGKNA